MIPISIYLMMIFSFEAQFIVVLHIQIHSSWAPIGQSVRKVSKKAFVK